jgi:tRNA dimethylallyltransferase
MTASPSVFLIAGPTASGKSALALSLAEATGGEIVNADSMQLYRDLAVLTARPTADETLRAPHHLYGVADAADGWSVGRWLAAASAVLDDIAGRGRDAVVVGGTGLYFRALTQGLAEVPETPQAARDAAGARFDRDGEAAFRNALRPLDPEAEARIAPGDRQRLVRAMAVAEATGRPLSAWQAETPPPPGRAWRTLVLAPPRQALYARCDARFSAMVAAGALEEARALLARGLDLGLPLMKAVGLRELGRHLAGEFSLEEAVSLAAQETRRYAKRQSTWFRNQAPDWPRVEGFGEGVEIERRTDRFSRGLSAAP